MRAAYPAKILPSSVSDLYHRLLRSLTRPQSVLLSCLHSKVDSKVCRSLQKSAVAEHALTNVDHRILFEETKLLKSVSAYFLRLHMESVQIQRHAAIAMHRRGESLSLTETKLLSAVSAYFPRLHMESVQIQRNAAITINRRGESLSLTETKLLSAVSAYFPRLHMESVQIQKHAAITMNRRGKKFIIKYFMAS